MKYRLGIDLGASSIGWAVTKLNNADRPSEVVDMGSRIFQDGRDAKTHTPLAVDRRMTRGASRNQDRRILRRERLLKYLKKISLMPTDESQAKNLATSNPYKCRAMGVKGRISAYELGRAIFHINKRRGFKSNRKTDGRDDDVGNMKKSIGELRKRIGNLTLGEFLFERQQKNQTTRMRSIAIKNKNSYEMYADRAMYEEEFEKLWETQAKYNSNLTDDKKQTLRDIMFSQRPLKTPERGRCGFEMEEYRAYTAYPISQAFRIFQEVNSLEIFSLDADAPRLTAQDRLKIADELLFNRSKLANKKCEITFAKIKKLLTLPSTLEFNLQSDSRTGLYIDKTHAVMSRKECFGDSWASIDDKLKEDLIDFLSTDHSDDVFIDFITEKFGVKEDCASEILDAFLDLPAGTTSLSSKAMRKILPFLKEGCLYDKACVAAGYEFSKKIDGNLLETLPYYGEVLRATVMGGKPEFDAEKTPEMHFGKIANPTVHVALNQLRKVVNKIIEVYGKPYEIVVETARDLPMGERLLSQEAKTQSDNKKKNEEIAAELDKAGVANNYKNRMKYKIWEDINADPIKRICPFCGKEIPFEKLFTDDFEIEHLLPFSETFDDGRGNKVISCRLCNRQKKNRSPYEAFGHSPKGWNWTDITARASLLARGKQWRFEENAFEQFKEKNGDIIVRMLNDTRYISKVAREYLTSITPINKVYTVVGKITALMRDKWGLNEILMSKDGDNRVVKNRSDNRHHAIDAFVISCVSRGLLQHLSECAKMAEEAGLNKLVTNFRAPFKDFNYEAFATKVDNINASYKLDRGNVVRAVSENKTLGALHKETALGPIGGISDRGILTVAKRISLDSLKPKIDNVKQVANPKIQADLLGILESLERLYSKDSDIKKNWLSKLADYTFETGVRRVRIHTPREVRKLIGIKDKAGKVYKYMDNSESYCMDIYLPSGSTEWNYEVVSMFAAHQRNFIPRWRKLDAHAKLVMRLFKSDTIAYDLSGARVLSRIVGIATHGAIGMLPINVAKIDNPNPPKLMPSSLQSLNARKVYVDEIGRVYDSGKGKYVK